MKSLLLSLIILSLFGCASTPPAQQITQAPDNDIALSEVNKSPERFLQSEVRWGGRIVKFRETEAADGKASFLKLEILAYPLDQRGKPIQSAESLGGRFIANVSEPYKKGRYYRNRWISVFGSITGTETYTLASGEEQVLPVLQAQNQYTWRTEYRDDDYYHDHYWWPRFYFRYGISNRGSRTGFGIFFRPHHFPRPRH